MLSLLVLFIMLACWFWKTIWDCKVALIMLSCGLSILEVKGEDIELGGVIDVGYGREDAWLWKAHISSMSAAAHTKGQLQNIGCS